ncbi:MAG: uL15 family ribosomal protein [Candidatus Micrarchaeota archaeon]|nr:uL15 family ribosomal protein [Candidatus Micrarchaeota archaeon]
MFKRKRKRINKYRGSRTCGTGNVKNKRGSGTRGGVGRGGIHKHKFSYVTTYDREWMKHGGRFGFVNPTKKEIPSINLYEIDNLLRAGKIKDKFEFRGKILGTGFIENAPENFEIVADSISKKAAQKLQQANIKFTSKNDIKGEN